MHIFCKKPRWSVWGHGVKQVETTRLHIGWNEEDVKMWDAFPYRGSDGELAYHGGPVIAIHENPGNIRISIIKTHAGSKYSQIGEVQVIDDTHTTQVIIDTSILSPDSLP